ncbi:hypothetical protein O4J56_00915 [Nocardiopsis sp. RSe5-2]|uniref:XRE family transcriptional regulator n=1 Tax=Nocardiopsis endophytica TaxID=3018445 RepID=A0ABT4TWW8_9ACTN|nr:hypothetical protein [Nocardiopsis endophytica]MDA2809185.1 hypothetical protein [Nocardiopsis endophytica]
MTATERFESGPQESMRTYRGDPDYVVVSGVPPRRVRVGSDGMLWGEVPVVPVQGRAAPPSPAGPGADGRITVSVPHPQGPAVSAVPSHHTDEGPSGGQAVPDIDGFDLRPDPMQMETPAAFMVALRQYRRWAGSPPYREMADRCGNVYSASAMCAALGASELPKYTMLNALILGCGGDEKEFQRWLTAWRVLDGQEKGEEAPTRPPMVLLPPDKKE